MKILVGRLPSLNLLGTMSKFGSYRRKSENCNKPFRRFRDQWSREECGLANFGTQSFNSFGEKFRNAPDNSNGRGSSLWRDQSRGKSGFPSGSGLRNPRDWTECNSNRSGYKNDVNWKSPHQNRQEARPGAPGTSGSEGLPVWRKKFPEGLRGKEIGLWHRDRQRERQKNNERKTCNNIVEVTLDPKTQTSIKELLDRADSEEPSEREFQDWPFYYTATQVTLEDKIEHAEVQDRVNNSFWDYKLYNELSEKISNPSSHYFEMTNFRRNLPCYKKKEEILHTIEQNQITLLVGATGSGKTTQTVQYVLDDYIMQKKGSLCNIVCTQPRRISAVSVAQRIASERDENLGKSVGYQIRLERVNPRDYGNIMVVTTGILLAWLQSAPTINHVSHLFLDEIHERNVYCDLIMALLKYILPKRPDLKVVLMSATVNPESFSSYFGGLPIVEVPGFTFPVKEFYLEDVLAMTRFTFPKQKCQVDFSFKGYVEPYVRELTACSMYPEYVTKELLKPCSELLNIQLTAAVVRHICLTQGPGAVLVFLPGMSDIYALIRELSESPWFSPNDYILIPIHSVMSTNSQMSVFSSTPPGVRKIVLATPILETSVTLDDIAYVVDCGKWKVTGYDKKNMVPTLEPVWISRANARQRRGRAGRTQPGKCYKLYTKVREQLLDSFPTPEIKTISLEMVILQAKVMGIARVAPFLQKMMDPPDPDMIDLSLKVLHNLKALNREEQLTPLGYHLSQLPMDPQTGKMILMAAFFGCIDPVFSIAACLSYKDPFVITFGMEENISKVKAMFAGEDKSDHLMYSRVLQEWEQAVDPHGFCRRNFLSDHILVSLREMKNQFAELLFDMKFLRSRNVKDSSQNVNSHNKELVKAVVCAGLYPNIAVLRKMAKSKKPVALFQTPHHESVRLHAKSVCSNINEFESPLFMYHHKIKSSAVFIHDTTMINPMPLLFFGERLDICRKGDAYHLIVDDFLEFKSTKEVGFLIKNMKTKMDEILESAIRNPTAFNWMTLDNKTAMLQSIVRLVLTDNQQKLN